MSSVLPAVNGAKVPILVEMDHPMTPDHHVTRVEVVVGTVSRNASGPNREVERDTVLISLRNRS